MPEPLKLGLVGAGNIAGAHLKGAARVPDSVRFTAIYDLVEAAAQRRSELAPGAAIYTDLSKFLSEADIEAVVICTTHDQHLPVALAAAAAGKHILVEKPFACTMDECHQMLRAAEANGVTLMVAQCQRYDASYQAIKKAIEGGELGTIRAVRLDAMQNIDSFLRPESWLFDGKRAGGGIIISVCVHRIDLMRFLVGNVKSVTATCRTINPKFKNGAEDLCAATLEFENGALGQVFASWNSYRLRYSESFMIFGDEGTIHAIPDTYAQMGPALIASSKRVPAATNFLEQFTGFEPVDPAHAEPTDLIEQFASQLAHLSECVRSGKEPFSSGRDNLGTMAIIFGIYESARRGTTVELAELLKA